MSIGQRSSWRTAASSAFLLDLRRFSREPVAVAATLVVPALVACIVSAALGGGADYRTTWAVVDQDQGAVARAFMSEVPRHAALRDVVEVEEVDEQEGRRLLERYDVSAMIVLPDGLTDSVVSGEPPQIEVVGPVAPGIGTDMAHAAVTTFAVRAWGAASSPGGAADREEIEVALTGMGGRAVDAASHFGPTVGLFFLLLSLGFGGQRIVEDRLRGHEERHRAAGVPRSATLVGRAACGVLLGVVCIAVTAVVMTLVFDRGWGPLASLVPLMVAITLTCVAIAALIASVARSAAGVQLLAASVAFVSLVLSGGFEPPGMGGTSSGIGRLSPLGRAQETLTYVAVADAPLGAVGADALFIVAWGLLCAAAVVGVVRWAR